MESRTGETTAEARTATTERLVDELKSVIERAEEKARLVRTLVLTAGVFFLAGVTAVMATLTIVFLASESARPPLLIGLTVFYVLATVAACLALRKHFHCAPPPFHDTVSELKKDRDWLNSRK